MSIHETRSMTMKRNRLLWAALLLFGGLLVGNAPTASAQTLKIGFIKDDSIKTAFPAFLRAQEQWELEKKAWDDEAYAKNEELNTLIADYEKQKLILSEDKRKEREAAIRAKKEALDAYTKQIYGPGGTAERKQMELLDPLLSMVNKAIEAVAVEEGYDVIFTLNSGLGYIKESYDVTGKVIDRLSRLEK